jgi:hypothetical protein
MALFVTTKRSNVRLGEIVERREGEFEGSPVFRCIVTWAATARGGPPPEVGCQLLDARNHRRLEELLGRPVEQMLDEWHVFLPVPSRPRRYARAMHRSIVHPIKPSTEFRDALGVAPYR